MKEMPSHTVTPRYTKGEEIANSITHGIGIILGIAGLSVLTAFSSLYGNAWHIVGCSIYGAAFIVLYTASTLYHSIQSPRAKSIMRVFDHAAIFILIAGTYTPFTLVNLRGPWGWSLFGVVWGVALIGIFGRLTFLKRWRGVSVALYIAMGWVVVTAIKPLINTVPAGGVVLLATGGLFYTSGVAFYLWRRLPYHHAIWHLFVLFGSVTHFFAVFFYVIPLAA